MADPVLTLPDDATLLDRAIAAATADLEASAGGASLCVLSRRGRAVPGVKYHEGRWAALREVARTARAGVPGTGLTATARAALTAWGAQLVALETSGAGEDWLAYRTGGVDAIAALLADLEVDS